METLKQWPSGRSRLLITVAGMFVLVAVGTSLAFLLLHSIRQRTVLMSTYPEGSLHAEVAKRYQDILARKGIQLKLVRSAGAVESVARLRDSKSGISIALIPGGITTEKESPELASLGTLFYQPLWIFSASRIQPRHKRLRRLRISIGPQGSSSRATSLMLLARSGVIDVKSTTLLSYAPSESAQKLIRGEIDVAIFLDGWESPVVQQLLHAKNIELQSIRRADAFVALYPYLTKLVLPCGVIDMTGPWPPKDVILISNRSSMIVRDDLPPAIQYMLLEAAVEIHSSPGIFHPANRFPAAESIDLPLSSYALEFYKTGTPFLLRKLPYWLATLLAEPIVWLIPALVILFPVIRFTPAVYAWFERRRVYRFYSELKRLEDEMAFAAPGRDRQDFLNRLDQLRDRASRISIPTAFEPLVYSLRLHIDMVRDLIEKPAKN